MKAKARSHWDTARGQVVGVRLTDEHYSLLCALARGAGISPGEYIKRLTMDSVEVRTRLALMRAVRTLTPR